MTKKIFDNFHEDFKDRHAAPNMPSNRLFGFTLGGILGAIGIIKGLIFGWWIIASLLIAAGAALAAAAHFAPERLKGANIFFTKAAPHIAKFMNPVLMGVIFVICFIPAGIIMKIIRRDPLDRCMTSYTPTYWAKREKHDLPDPMKYQF